MPRANGKPKKEDINSDYVRMYYEHQYERIKMHLDQSINMSNIVLTISALMITFGINNKQSFGSVLILFLPLFIVIANIFVVLYIRDSGKWIISHRLRAKKILERYMPELYELDAEIAFGAPYKGINSRQRIQSLLHIMLILIGIALLAVYILEIFGVSIA